MENPIENALSGMNQEGIDKMIQQRISQELAMVQNEWQKYMQEEKQEYARLLTATRMRNLQAKIDLLSQEDRQQLDAAKMDNLRHLLAKAENLDAQDIHQAEDMLHIMNEAIEKIGDKKIAWALSGKTDFEKLPQEKKMAHFAANLAKEMQKYRNEILGKTRERLGLA